MLKKAIALLIICTASVEASDSNLICPATAQVGGPLLVTATIENEQSSPLVINKVVFNLLGNIDGKSIGLLGPNVYPIAPFTIPAANCNPPYQYVCEPSLETFENVAVITNIPVSMANTLAVANAAVIDENNKTHMVGTCLVHITN